MQPPDMKPNSLLVRRKVYQYAKALSWHNVCTETPYMAAMGTLHVPSKRFVLSNAQITQSRLEPQGYPLVGWMTS